MQSFTISISFNFIWEVWKLATIWLVLKPSRPIFAVWIVLAVANFAGIYLVR